MGCVGLLAIVNKCLLLEGRHGSIRVGRVIEYTITNI